LYTQGGTGKQLVFNITYVEIGWIGQKNKDQRTNLHGADGEMMEEFSKNSLNKTYGKSRRTYTYAQLDCKYDALCLKDKNTVLRGALEYMQQYNGRIIKFFM
jgi:hypothetical protein